MKKFIEKIKAAYAKAKNWIGTDGILHILACIVIILSLVPFINLLLAIIAALLAGLVKEYKDVFIDKDNTKSESLKDIACDAIGIIAASVIYILGVLVNYF